MHLGPAPQAADQPSADQLRAPALADSLGHQSLIPPHRLPALPAKIPLDRAGILPVPLNLAPQRGVAGPGISA
jgi:hypothetical protein